MGNAIHWPLYAIVEVAQGLKLVGITIDPTKASESKVTINLAKARRLTGRSFIGKTLMVTDPGKVSAIKAASSNPAAFVNQMKALGEERKAGKNALKGIALLRDLLKG